MVGCVTRDFLSDFQRWKITVMHWPADAGNRTMPKTGRSKFWWMTYSYLIQKRLQVHFALTTSQIWVSSGKPKTTPRIWQVSGFLWLGCSAKDSTTAFSDKGTVWFLSGKSHFWRQQWTVFWNTQWADPHIKAWYLDTRFNSTRPTMVRPVRGVLWLARSVQDPGPFWGLKANWHKSKVNLPHKILWHSENLPFWQGAQNTR